MGLLEWAHQIDLDQNTSIPVSQSQTAAGTHSFIPREFIQPAQPQIIHLRCLGLALLNKGAEA
jgi:hypothetical protein